MVSQETLAKIAELKQQIADIESTAHREDLFKGVKKNYSDEELYPLAKAFTNHVEKSRKVKNLEEARRIKAEQEAQSAPAS